MPDQTQRQALWGIDLDGTKIECAVLRSMENPKVLRRTRIATQGHLSYRHVLRQIHQLVDNVNQDLGFAPYKIGYVFNATMKTCFLRPSVVYLALGF